MVYRAMLKSLVTGMNRGMMNSLSVKKTTRSVGGGGAFLLCPEEFGKSYL